MAHALDSDFPIIKKLHVYDFRSLSHVMSSTVLFKTDSVELIRICHLKGTVLTKYKI